MKGYGQILDAVFRDTVDTLKQIAPDSPAVKRAEAVLRKAEKEGVKPSGRPPTERENNRRAKLYDKIVERDAADQEAARLYTSGLSLIETGQRLGGRSTAWVLGSLARTHTPTRPRGASQRHPDQQRIDRLRAMRAEGKTLEEMGAAEHITRERVRQICLVAGIDTSPSQELSDHQNAAVAEYLAGGSLKLVAVRYGVGTDTIKHWVTRAGHVPRLEKRPNSEQTKRDAERAAKLYRQGKKAREIAEILGRGKPETIYRLLAIAGVHPDRQPKSGRHGMRR